LEEPELEDDELEEDGALVVVGDPEPVGAEEAAVELPVPEVGLAVFVKEDAEEAAAAALQKEVTLFLIPAESIHVPHASETTFKLDRDVKTRGKPTIIRGAVVIAGQEVRVLSAHTGVIAASYTFRLGSV